MTEDFLLKIRQDDKLKPVPLASSDPLVFEFGRENVLIPECCREGWASCPHVVKKNKPAKRNLGL